MHKKYLPVIVFIAIISVLAQAPLLSGEDTKAKPVNPVADPIISSQSVHFIPLINFKSISLRVLLPSGQLLERAFSQGDSLLFQLPAGTPDGVCTYELRVTPQGTPRRSARIHQQGEDAKSTIPDAPVQSGYLQVRNGGILVPQSGAEISQPLDIVHNDDVIIDGSLCVGNDCYSGLAFGFDTIVQMENNLRIFFDDTSTIQNYPRNDWRIVINDSTDGGGNYFAIQDATEVNTVFTLEAGAPDNSLYVDSHGDVGIGTSTPYYELHIVDGDSPCLRLDQDGSYGWSPQKWDLCGNESNFFIRDATHASKLPFRIQPDAPTDSITIKSTGFVGFGTGAPGYKLHARTTGEHCILVTERTDGATFKLAAKDNRVQLGSISNHDIRFTTNNTSRMAITTSGYVGIGDLTPTHLLDVGNSGAYCNGGAWVDGSSLAFKQDIRSIDTAEATKAVMNLRPVRFRYKTDTSEEFLGFIAEEVPELVAMKDRKGMTAMDVVAALTKVVQQQQKTMLTQRNTLREQSRKLEAQAVILAELQEKIKALQKR